MLAWWAARARQALHYFRPEISSSERAALSAWLSPAQMRLFDSMHPADRRHGIDVVTSLRAAGRIEPELLLAGLFHDAGKGREVGFGPRVAWALGERYGARIWSAASRLPSYRAALERMRTHAERSGELALAAGCTPVTAALIRGEGEHAEMAAALRIADEQN